MRTIVSVGCALACFWFAAACVAPVRQTPADAALVEPDAGPGSADAHKPDGGPDPTPAFVEFYGNSGRARDVVTSLHQLADGGFVVASQSLRDTVVGTVVSGFDSLGSREWAVEILNATWPGPVPTTAVTLTDGTVVVIGTYMAYPAPYPAWIVRLETSGVVRSAFNVAGFVSDYPSSEVMSLADGGYLVYGVTRHDPPASAVVRFDAADRVVWQHSYSDVRWFDAMQLPGGDLVLTGYPPVVARLSSSGEVVWAKRFSLQSALLDYMAVSPSHDGQIACVAVAQGPECTGLWVANVSVDGVPTIQKCVTGEMGWYVQEAAFDGRILGAAGPTGGPVLTLNELDVVTGQTWTRDYRYTSWLEQWWLGGFGFLQPRAAGGWLYVGSVSGGYPETDMDLYILGMRRDGTLAPTCLETSEWREATHSTDAPATVRAAEVFRGEITLQISDSTLSAQPLTLRRIDRCVTP